MISGADLDGDGRINYGGARPFLSSRPHPLQFATLTTFVMQSSSRYMQFAPFLRVTWSLIVIGADDAANVIMPCRPLRSRLGVSSSPSMSSVPELKLKECKGRSLISCVFGSRSNLCLFWCRFMTLVLYNVIVRLYSSMLSSATTHSTNGPGVGTAKSGLSLERFTIPIHDSSATGCL